MIVKDYTGTAKIRTRDALLERLASYRDGRDGAFEISHNGSGATLCVLFHETFAYLHYFPDPDFLNHAGYRSVNMALQECPEVVLFRTVDDGPIEVARESILDENMALNAASEFYTCDSLPTCVKWEEL